MGQRHNRKRTRSRPRRNTGNTGNIGSVPNEVAYPSTIQSLPFISAPSINRPGSPASACSDSEDHTNARRVHVFGGDAGDEAGELCAPMLQVLLDLFDGVDYDDK
ncbi:hypothetical protein AAFC00_003129 [Neodothiora populina]|uniref:Uncharacterized protein n=1 Tax=Neodothiora populina TaxID=2781224 RepID=A0ABR3PA38_9PEZI